MANNFNPTYYNVIDQIYHTEWVAGKLARLEFVKQSVKQLWPQGHSTQCIQIAGTSGKGSVCHYLAAGFSLKHTSATFTSPHLFDYRERFSIQEEYVSQQDIIEVWESIIKPLCIKQAFHGEYYVHTVHEINILMALALWEKYQVDWGMVETGIGGRYDQTTALDVEAAVITNIGNDHQDLLGKERWQRALDKGGICRKGKPLFTSIQDSESLDIIKALSREMDAPLYVVSPEKIETVRDLLHKLYPHGLPDESLLYGEHQLWNAALSLMVTQHFFPEIPREDILQKFVGIRYTGRFQKIEEGLYVDIAHNQDKVRALADEITDRFSDKRKIFIVGLSGARHAKEIFPPILAIADEVIITTASYKGVPVDTLERELRDINEREIPLTVLPEPQEALKYAKRLQKENTIVILTGSTYMIDQVLNPDPFLRYINASYGWRTQKSI